MLFFFNKNKKQLEAIFDWLSGVVCENDLIFVDLPRGGGYYSFEFPLRYGDKPKKAKVPPKGKSETFVFRLSDSQNELPESWVKIFSSPEIEVFESKSRASDIPPLRWGLNKDEKKFSIKLAREALIKFLTSSEQLNYSELQDLRRPIRFQLKTDLDIALWVNGRLRGSAVVENRNLGEGIAEAAIMAGRDSRFKPLDAEELPHTRIEITIMHNLRVPLSSGERKKNVIYSEKGYLLERGLSKGWYLPEVFNVRRFRNLEEFLGSLAEEKAKLNRSALQDANVFIFEVDDFIESADYSSALALWGPIVKVNPMIPDSKFVIQRLRVAADWLLRIQESDGNIPSIINPLTGHQTQIDWPRLAFTAWALAEFGKATQEKKYLLAAEKSFSYLRNYLIYDFQFSIPSRELTLAYFGRLSLALGQSKDAALAAEKILVSFSNISFEPILFAQIASFLKVLSNNAREYFQTLENICGILKNAFEKNRRGNISISLAVWAELVNLFSDIDVIFSGKATDWLKSQQLPNGTFPESTISDFVYTRGTGKILEVLALDPEGNKPAIEKGLAWLFSMQYDEENMFFVPEEIRPRIIGALRHDYFNPEAWIDGVGHFLIGGTRLIENKILWK